MKCAIAALIGASILSAEGPPRPRLLGISHVAFFVKDIEKSRAFYHDFLGFDQIAGPNVCFKVNARQFIELIPEREPNTDRLDHVAIETENVEAMRVYLESHGIAVPDPIRRESRDIAAFSVTDPEGHTLEFAQYTRTNGDALPATRISTRLMHAGIIVTSLDREMKFYTEVLGFRETWRGSKSETELSWINLKVPDGEDYLEFMLHKEAPPPTARGTAHHICLEVPEIEKSVKALEARPYRKQYSRSIEIRTGVNRKRQANLYDPDGTRTELMEPLALAAFSAAAQEPTSDYFTTSDGVKIHYITIGYQGSWVVLIHGFTDTAERMFFSTGIAQALAKTHRVVALDNRNHGLSDRPRPNGTGRAEDTIELMDHLGIEKAHIHGYSMGGNITARLLAAHPERFLTAAFGGSGIAETDPQLRRRAAALDPKMPAPQGVEAAAFQRLRDAAARAQTNPTPLRPPLRIDLTMITIPVLAINGEFDSPHAKTQRMARELKNFSSVILPGKNHISAIAIGGPIPQQYVDALVDFINANDSR